MGELSHDPRVLFHASIERNQASWNSIERKDYVLAMYLAGLSVECILQAIVLKNGGIRDAKHSLKLWVAKCPISLQDAIKRDARSEWSMMVAMWDNTFRYFSEQAMLGYLRAKGYHRNISGGSTAVLKKNGKELVAASEVVQKKGLAQWVSYAKK